MVLTSRIASHLQALLCRLSPDVRIGASPQSLGEVWPQLDLIGHTALRYGLGIGITNDEIHSLYVLAEHMVYCIAATTTHTNDLDDG